VFHEAAFAIAIVAGIVVVVEAAGARRTIAAAVFAASTATMLGASALYHRVNWSARVRPWMRRVDHLGVYGLIAGSYTPVGLLVLHGAVQTIVLAIVWTGAAAAAVFKFCWLRAPTWLSAAIGIALGWVGVVAVPQVLDGVGIGAFALLAAGGIAYSLGGIVYALRRPDPVPAVFGYHELFHALTIVALTLQYVAISFFVVRVG
jgi:hemolysin III